ncbi:MAG: heavy metal-associated domain-containing protein [Chloroflexota bacterium]
MVRRIEIAMPGINCEASTIERILCEVPGVVEVYVNPASEIAYCDCDDGPAVREGLVAAIKRLGYRAVITNP